MIHYKLTKRDRPRTSTTLDIKPKLLNPQIFPINPLHSLLLTVKLPPPIKKGGTGGTLDGEGKHHTNGDQVIFGLFGARDELRIEVGGDVFVEDFAFTHD